MTIAVKAYANADDVLIAWQPDRWSDDWAGFQLERRNDIGRRRHLRLMDWPIKPQPGHQHGRSSVHEWRRSSLQRDHGQEW